MSMYAQKCFEAFCRGGHIVDDQHTSAMCAPYRNHVRPCIGRRLNGKCRQADGKPASLSRALAREAF
jgi:hypothetical protein